MPTGAGAGAGGAIVVVNCSQGFGVVPAINPIGVSTQAGVVGPGVVGGAGVVTGGGIVGGGVIFHSGGGPSVGSMATVMPGRPGKPGSGAAGAIGSGGGGPGRGGGGGGGGMGGCAGAGMVVVGGGKANAAIAAACLHLPDVAPWQLQLAGIPRPLCFSQPKKLS